MSAKLVGLSFIFAAAFALPCRAGLLLSEFVFNEVGSDVTGEWVEIFNTGPTTISLSNHKVGDEETSGGTGTGETMHQFPLGASIGSGELQIVAVSATRFFDVYGILPTYEINETNVLVPNMSTYATWDPDGGVLNMGNTGDHIYLLGPAAEIVDRASWGNNNAFNPGLAQPVLDGQSYERKNSYIDTDTADDWQLVEGATAAERSTPFSANVPEPASVVLLGLSFIVAPWLRRR
jgi:hypothetical protein